MIEDRRRPTKSDADTGSASTSLPVAMLTGLGALITVLGLFAAGDLAVVIVGLVAIAVGGVLHVLDGRL